MSGCGRPPPPLIILTHAEVSDPSVDLNDKVDRAFGPGGLGVIAIRGIPGFVVRRQRQKWQTLSYTCSSYFLELQSRIIRMTHSYTHE